MRVCGYGSFGDYSTEFCDNGHIVECTIGYRVDTVGKCSIGIVHIVGHVAVVEDTLFGASVYSGPPIDVVVHYKDVSKTHVVCYGSFYGDDILFGDIAHAVWCTIYFLFDVVDKYDSGI